MPGVCMICTEMSPNGLWINTSPRLIKSELEELQQKILLKNPQKPTQEHCGEALGWMPPNAPEVQRECLPIKSGKCAIRKSPKANGGIPMPLLSGFGLSALTTRPGRKYKKYFGKKNI